MARIALVCSSLFLVVLFFVGSGYMRQDGAGTAQPSSKTQDGGETKLSLEEQFIPIDNMHHFMEYISQPNYLALKEALAKEPADRRAYRSIKSHALILAETSALVARRFPEGADEEQIALWQQLSLDVYNAGKALYQSGGDYAKSRASYELMIDNCNKCHQEFDEANHQLEK